MKELWKTAADSLPLPLTDELIQHWTSQQDQLSSYQPSSSIHRTLLCVDSFQGTSQKAGYCATLVNTDGKVIDGKAGSFLCRTPTCAKATALYHAVNIALLYPYPTIIYSDCRIVVDALITSHDQWPWDCDAILAKITDVLMEAPWIEIRHCNRRFVQQVDRIARLSRDDLLPSG
ncbi:hypothetical protein LINPERPRIM_LOCUS20230 [Linum perenne]